MEEHKATIDNVKKILEIVKTIVSIAKP